MCAVFCRAPEEEFGEETQLQSEEGNLLEQGTVLWKIPG